MRLQCYYKAKLTQLGMSVGASIMSSVLAAGRHDNLVVHDLAGKNERGYATAT